MASMIKEESEAFLPVALLYCCTGWMALSRMTSFQEAIWLVVQLP